MTYLGALSRGLRLFSGFRNPLLRLLFVLVFFTAPGVAEELPSLGENSGFNIREESEIGERVYQRLLASGAVETNPLLDRYINELGARLLSALDNRVRDYRFFIVRSDRINAFALPGGYIGVNSGLIQRAENQHQLASVLAHEIAHVRLRHGIKLMKKSSGVNSAALIAIFAGLLAGSGSDLGAALVYGGAAGGQQAMINYTREFEYEADRLGISLLQGADFDGAGMVDFFRLLARSTGSSEIQNIEYLRTHPVSSNRISEAEARLKPFPANPTGPDYFPLFQDYLAFSSAGGTGQGRGRVFYLALEESRSGDLQKAEAMLRHLFQAETDNIWYGYAYTEILELLERWDEAENVCRRLLAIYPDDFLVSLKLVGLLKSSSRFDQALRVARRLESRYPEDKRVYFELVEIYRELGDRLAGMIAQADYYRLSGSSDQAARLYADILGSANLDPLTESRVRERLAGLKRR